MNKKPISFFILFLILLSVFTLFSGAIDLNSVFSENSNTQPTEDNTKRAAIVDQLSVGVPNQTFVNRATDILETAGYQVDYYPGEKVTVDFYKELPKKNYDIIVFRVHSSMSMQGENPVVLFTSEEYETGKYRLSQLSGNLKKVYFEFEDVDYFGITPQFVRGLDGNFNNATIIQMGCEGIERTNMAEAFVEKGAKVYISWTGPVAANHTDAATIIFLKQYITQGSTVERAMQITHGEIGEDPEYNSILKFYPPEADYKRAPS